MKNKVTKSLLILTLVVGALLSIQVVKAASDIVARMANKEVNVDEVFAQNRLSSQGEGFFDVINSELLAKDFSYEKNKEVKSEVDKKIDEMKNSGTDYLKEYNVKSELELLIKSGTVLSIQEEQYVKAKYIKKYVTNESLKKLYDQRKGELVSYAMIKIDPATLDNDQKKIADARTDIIGRIEKAKPEELKDIFKELNEKYNSSDTTAGIYENKNRSEVDEKTLKELDKLKYLQVTKNGVSLDGSLVFLLKLSKDERPTFEASKEKLTDLQYQTALENNQYLKDYFLVLLRQDQKIEFKNEKDKIVYDAATAKIIKNYNDAQKDGDK